MLADLHAHYPMRVVEDLTPQDTVNRMRTLRGRPFGEKVRAAILWIASTLFSNRDWWSGYRIDVDKMRKGNVKVALSVLYRPFEEIDLSKSYADPPDGEYFSKLKADLLEVEEEVATHGDSVIRTVSDRAGLERAMNDDAIALVHCVEGGFHLGATQDELDRNVAWLARKGVAYVTLAHLFYRRVATNAPALPFLKTDRLYRLLFPQPDQGLTALGEAAVRALVRHRVMIDISHMNREAIAETVRLLDDELDRECEFPLIATHGGYRFGKQEYMLDESGVGEIRRRDGVIGLIMAQYQLNNGIRRGTTSNLAESFAVIRRHIDRIAEITGSHRHVALGTDFDGFIKPTMGGLDDMADLAALEEVLQREYGEDAGLICSENAIRVLRRLWA
jgi:microsomal dipeptidase-like Zn-dependent dipeptidase